ncbi:hypothetical protein VN97_g3840 [Penicillium thymicola]|uniref:Uncharacterized protein n=1 Tax=Penicillium thymicola TaxID=293382 RepID=A0AAI9XA36_PENTH|nr:hypothetical protein VN97_g3840 [Penicillium thymicola]
MVKNEDQNRLAENEIATRSGSDVTRSESDLDLFRSNGLGFLLIPLFPLFPVVLSNAESVSALLSINPTRLYFQPIASPVCSQLINYATKEEGHRIGSRTAQWLTP